MKIGPMGAELSHADRRTNIKKLTVAFRNSVNALINLNHAVQYKIALEISYVTLHICR